MFATTGITSSQTPNKTPADSMSHCDTSFVFIQLEKRVGEVCTFLHCVHSEAIHITSKNERVYCRQFFTSWKPARLAVFACQSSSNQPRGIPNCTTQAQSSTAAKKRKSLDDLPATNLCLLAGSHNAHSNQRTSINLPTASCLKVTTRANLLIQI